MGDDADTIAQKFRKARTDPEPLPETYEALKDRPSARNLVDIFSALSERSREDVMGEVQGMQWGTFKPLLADLAVEKLSPISGEMTRLLADPAEIDRVLARGAERADEIATPILEKTYDIVGLVSSRR